MGKVRWRRPITVGSPAIVAGQNSRTAVSLDSTSGLNRGGANVSYFAQNHGLAASCLELDAPGEPDASCPSTSIALPFGSGKTIKLEGCRTRSARCGYDVNLPGIVNLGCTPAPAKI